MGVTLFDGPKLLTSYLYYDLKGWTYSKTEDMFVLKVKKKDGKAVGETIKFQTKHDEGAIIAEAMNEHAQGLAQATKKQSQASTDAIPWPQSGFAGLLGPGEKVFDVQVRRMQLCLSHPMFLV